MFRKNRPETSCIIITLNEEKYLPILLESLKQQTYKNFEVIVADYNSKDKTREIAKKFSCIITKGGNYTAGRNNGAKISKGKYLVFLDADSYLPKDFLEINIKRLKQSKKGLGTVEVKPMYMNNSDNIFVKLFRIIFDKLFFKIYHIWVLISYKFSPYCAGCGIFVRRNMFEQIKGFNEKVVFAENHDFAYRAMPYGFIILPRAMYTSVRRMDKEGRIKFVIKYIYAGLYRILLRREIEKHLFNYDNQRD